MFSALFGIVVAVFVLRFIGSFAAISLKNLFGAHNLADMGTKLLGYKELYDIATGNNKSDYGDIIDRAADNFLGKHRSQ